jgi:hypothetical protein
MHSKHSDLARRATCWQDTPEDEATDSLFDRVIFACAWLGAVFVLLAAGMGIIP